MGINWGLGCGKEGVTFWTQNEANSRFGWALPFCAVANQVQRCETKDNAETPSTLRIRGHRGEAGEEHPSGFDLGSLYCASCPLCPPVNALLWLLLFWRPLLLCVLCVELLLLPLLLLFNSAIPHFRN